MGDAALRSHRVRNGSSRSYVRCPPRHIAYTSVYDARFSPEAARWESEIERQRGRFAWIPKLVRRADYTCRCVNVEWRGACIYIYSIVTAAGCKQLWRLEGVAIYWVYSYGVEFLGMGCYGFIGKLCLPP